MAALNCNGQAGTPGSVPDEAALSTILRNTVTASIENGGARVERSEPREGNFLGARPKGERVWQAITIPCPTRMGQPW
jgi:hypothetical protein